MNLKYLLIGLGSLFLAATLGLAQEAFFTEFDEYLAFDFYTISHFFVYFGLFFVLVALFPAANPLYVALGLAIAGTLFEPFEQVYLFPRFPSWGDFLYEMPLNPLFDIFFNLLGLVVALWLWAKLRSTIYDFDGTLAPSPAESSGYDALPSETYAAAVAQINPNTDYVLTGRHYSPEMQAAISNVTGIPADRVIMNPISIQDVGGDRGAFFKAYYDWKSEEIGKQLRENGQVTIVDDLPGVHCRVAADFPDAVEHGRLRLLLAETGRFRVFDPEEECGAE